MKTKALITALLLVSCNQINYKIDVTTQEITKYYTEDYLEFYKEELQNRNSNLNSKLLNFSDAIDNTTTLSKLRIIWATFINNSINIVDYIIENASLDGDWPENPDELSIVQGIKDGIDDWVKT